MIAICKERYRLFTILIINVFTIFIFAESSIGLQQIMDKDIHATSVCIVEDCMDFDEDENEDYLPESYGGQLNALPPVWLLITCQASSEIMIDKALRIGLVRRHFQREKRIDDYYYAIFHNGSSGVDLFYITFFVQFTPFFIKSNPEIITMILSIPL